MVIPQLGQGHLCFVGGSKTQQPLTGSSLQWFVPFDWCEGEVTFTEMWASALQLGIVRSNFVNSRNCRRYLFAERSLGCIPMSWRIRQHAALVRGVVLCCFTLRTPFLFVDANEDTGSCQGQRPVP